MSPNNSYPDSEPNLPGQILSQSRQAKGWKESDVAQKLHLNVAIIQALENDQYETIPSQVFVNGYIRNYANLLGLDMAQIPSIPKLATPHVIHPHTQTKSSSNINQEIGSNHILIRIINWLIVLVLISSVVLWWQGQFGWDNFNNHITYDSAIAPIEDYPESVPTISDPSTTPSVPIPGTLPSEPDKTGPSNNSSPSHPITDSILAPALAIAMPSTTKSSSENQQSKPSNNTIKTNLPSTNHQNSQTANNQTDKPNHSVVLKFLDACWVNIKDSKGTKLTRTMKKGQKHILTGALPYKLLFGNSKAVKITINNKPFDIQKYSRGGIAKFTLDASILNQ